MANLENVIARLGDELDQKDSQISSLKSEIKMLKARLQDIDEFKQIVINTDNELKTKINETKVLKDKYTQLCELQQQLTKELKQQLYEAIHLLAPQ